MRHPDFLFPNIKHLVIDKSFQGVNYRYKLSYDSKLVTDNLNYIKEYLKANELVILNQTHSTKAHIIDDKNITDFHNRREGDALVTNAKNIALTIMTADCVPVFFADPENMVIGIAHAGWRGARHGIISKTLQKMKEIGADISLIRALIGPCIHQESYEVDVGFYEDFVSESQDNEQFFLDSIRNGHYMFDLPGYIKNQLSFCGVQNISQIDDDTFARDDLYPSYRRSTLSNVACEENILSVIMLGDENA
jgi:YfiH family protein